MENLKPERVFKYFREICAIPHGSGNMEKISAYCEGFAKANGLDYIRDDVNNVIIYKPASAGYETASPVILQGHLDMVCQKDEGVNIDFETDGLDIFLDGDYLKAKGTTLGADNGIAVAMIMAILEDKTISHPSIEAVFTIDEEIGLIGAGKLQFDKLKGKRMINMDSEEQEILTVSCAGGSDFRMILPIKRTKRNGTEVEIAVKGLLGGHSGVEIDKNRVNANILMGQILQYAKENFDIDIISVNGGDKSNAIPNASTARIVVQNLQATEKIKEFATTKKAELAEREPDLICNITAVNSGEFEVFEKDLCDRLVFALFNIPDGVMEMSAEIEGLVETSLNLGVLNTGETGIVMHSALRSNKKSGLVELENKMKAFASMINADVETFGHYPPWEFKPDSALQELYKEKYKEKFGEYPLVRAIHAGLECGMFAEGISGIDCISIGPEMHDVHTTKERLSVSSVKSMYELIINVLAALR
ncbi:MAG: aminoacyl-histidine dipeptidase [Clostridia bacterium]|nr:aminoacyl-histidine dipeptidase [Clostridia bacterium]